MSVVAVAPTVCVRLLPTVMFSDHQRERLVLLVTIDSQIIGLFSAATKVVFHACYYLLPAHVSELAVCLRERARSAPVQNGAMERV